MMATIQYDLEGNQLERASGTWYACPICPYKVWLGCSIDTVINGKKLGNRIIANHMILRHGWPRGFFG
jgi:hypothetical protein